MKTLLVLGVLIMVALAPQLGAAGVKYEKIYGDVGDGGRVVKNLTRVGVGTAGGEVSVLFYTDETLVPDCSAPVKSVEDALAIDSLVRKYVQSARVDLKIWCTMFRESGKQNFINIAMPRAWELP